MTALPPPETSAAAEATVDEPVVSEPTAVEGQPGERPQQIVGMSFDKVSRADEVLLNLVHLQQEGQISLADAVVVSKNDDDRVHIRQTVDPSPKTGALSGSMWGLFIGLIFGPVGSIIGAVAGAGTGALAAKLVDIGLDDGWIKQVGTWLDPGTSALLLLVADEVGPIVVAELRRFEGQVLYCTFPDAVRHELERALAANPLPQVGTLSP